MIYIHYSARFKVLFCYVGRGVIRQCHIRIQRATQRRLHKREVKVEVKVTMKQRFSSLDVAAIVQDLRQQLLSLRVQNIYDVNPKTFLLKFAKPDVKCILLIESGIRLHTTVYSRDKGKTPGGFAQKVSSSEGYFTVCMFCLSGSWLNA